ncbi:hypothetical protein B0G81_2522 [Paraburkholderia sp. BL6665CI2N2]|uniref:hypothetical protein n=1 Tax=Paraburkholderia sp. BL6665CI2N2 TaxID=1938806 RepID=UPI0010665E14|nr:hypothetical protein [Paraburkholderia sp. BL6665CI2N2]TDY22229.1 hypothetical protein B0G81_2522 [Paraburkholderia sp. BL6665CI2N2]
MPACPLLRASLDARKVEAQHRAPTTRTSTHASRWLAMSANLAGWVGWRALRDVLNAIPDSNDDFSLF